MVLLDYSQSTSLLSLLPIPLLLIPIGSLALQPLYSTIFLFFQNNKKEFIFIITMPYSSPRFGGGGGGRLFCGTGDC